jgi:hypothetical protein
VINIALTWETYFLGARLFYWFYLFLTLIAAGGIFAYHQRERIKKEWYAFRFPEKLLHVIMVYPGNYRRDFWRLIPEDSTFELDGGTYMFENSSILKNNTWYAYKDKKAEGRLILKIEDKEYYLDDKLKLKSRWDKFPEIYYLYGCPFPVDWSKTREPVATTKDRNGEDIEKPIIFNAQDFERLKKSTILTQIYATLSANGTMILLIILVIVVLILSAVGVLNDAGIIHLAQNVTVKK